MGSTVLLGHDLKTQISGGCSSHPRPLINRHLQSTPSSTPEGSSFLGFHRIAPSPSDSRSLSTVGRCVGSCCQQVVVNFHSSSVYPREVAKSGFLGLVPLIICRTTDQELYSWNGRLSVRTWEELRAGEWWHRDLVDNLPHKSSFPWSICPLPLWRVSTRNRPWCILVGNSVDFRSQNSVAPGHHLSCPVRG